MMNILAMNYKLTLLLILLLPLSVLAQDSADILGGIQTIGNIIAANDKFERETNGNMMVKPSFEDGLEENIANAFNSTLTLKQFIEADKKEEQKDQIRKLIGNEKGEKWSSIKGKMVAASIPYVYKSANKNDSIVSKLNKELKQLEKNLRVYLASLTPAPKEETPKPSVPTPKDTVQEQEVAKQVKVVNKTEKKHKGNQKKVVKTKEPKVPNIVAEVNKLVEEKDSLSKELASFSRDKRNLEAEIKILTTNKLELSENISNWKYISYALSGLLALLLIGTSIFAMSKNKNNNPIPATSDLKNISTNNVENILPNPQKAINPILPFIPNSKDRAYFFSEVMVTAGPRKNFGTDAAEGDFGLGEDVAGLMTIKDRTFFWLLDGTSDAAKIYIGQAKKELFSSRLLAQTIAWNIQQIFSEINWAELNPKQTLIRAIQQMKQEWQQKINSLPPSETQALITKLREVKVLQCSTTVILGLLTLNGQLRACQIGDSKILTKPTKLPSRTSKGRLFATLKLSSTEQILLDFNGIEDTEAIEFSEAGIKTVVAVTDGISSNTEAWINAQAKIDFTNSNIRETLVHRNEKTQDDKAICIVQIKQLAN